MPAATASGMSAVYSLYDLQNDFLRFLALPHQSLRRRGMKAEYQKKLRSYTNLLNEVKRKHRGYLGGEDVLITLELLRAEVLAKINACAA
jgi:hypothetical protein